MVEFYEKFAEIVEEEKVTEQDRFREFENWDSLSLLVLLAMVDSDYSVTITADDIEKINTVGELYSLIESRQA